jgi:RimJ/RimL family protein N-acetyltransferase
VRCLNDPAIPENTLAIPFPYSEADGTWFIGHSRKMQKLFGHPLNFALHTADGTLIGGIGFHGRNQPAVVAHRDEIGYWIAAPFRGKGIMTQALPVVLRYGREVRGLLRFEAPVFAHNLASERVLLKCGFTMEGLAPKAYFKGGKYIDAKMFALTLPE